MYKYLQIFTSYFSILYCNASYTFVNLDTELLVYHVYTKNENTLNRHIFYLQFSYCQQQFVYSNTRVGRLTNPVNEHPQHLY